MSTTATPAPKTTPALKGRMLLRAGSMIAGLLLPTLTLVPLGSLWLWEHGYLLHWAVLVSVLVAVAYLVQRLMFKRAERKASAERATVADDVGDAATPDSGWTPLETKAWTDVLAVARAVDPNTLTSREALLELGVRTIDVVAKRLHPEVSDPVWQFTLPEACAISEQISRKLGTFAAENIPLGDRLTVAQVLALYRWRGAVDVAEKAYDVWRLVRLANPLAAVTHEARERMTRQILTWGREQVAERLSFVFVTEVGRAAIDLYGGRLRVPKSELESAVSASSSADLEAISRRTAEPLRILVAGQVGSGKSALVNALLRRNEAVVDALPVKAGTAAYALELEGLPNALVIDARALTGDKASSNALLKQAEDCDLLVWTSAADRADRSLDRQWLAAFRERFALSQNRRRPPLVVALTRIDRLRPFNQWQPPYDLHDAADEKVRSITAAIDSVTRDLSLAPSDVVPISLYAAAPFNVPALVAHIHTLLPDAQQAQLVRRLAGHARSSWSWQRLRGQVANAGRTIGRTSRRSK